jgi:hypothetical protein
VRSSETVFIQSYSEFGEYVNYIKTIKSAIMKYGALAVIFRYILIYDLLLTLKYTLDLVQETGR